MLLKTQMMLNSPQGKTLKEISAEKDIKYKKAYQNTPLKIALKSY